MSNSEVAFLNCQFQRWLVNTLEDCPKVPGEVRSFIGCDSKVVHVLSRLVSFDNWVQVLTHGTWKSGHRSAKSLCKSFVGKSSASEIECELFHCLLIRHLQAVIKMGTVNPQSDCWCHWYAQKQVICRWVSSLLKWDLRTYIKAVPWWFHICALELIQQLGLLSIGSALVHFGFRQFCCLSGLVSPWILCSTPYPFCALRN